MIANIVDAREKPYRWKTINVVMESTWHDNSCTDADHADKEAAPEVLYEERLNIAVSEAIIWGTDQAAEVTLYFYDSGQGFEK